MKLKVSFYVRAIKNWYPKKLRNGWDETADILDSMGTLDEVTAFQFSTASWFCWKVTEVRWQTSQLLRRDK